jgi:hypothetical protein
MYFIGFFRFLIENLEAKKMATQWVARSISAGHG